jgi:uncharacterized membrane protein YczE
MTQNNEGLINGNLKGLGLIMKRGLFYFIGLALTALGVSSLIESNMGASTWDALYVGLSHTVGLTPGIWVIIIGGMVIFLNAFLAKERPDFTSFLTIFILGMIIDFY